MCDRVWTSVLLRKCVKGPQTLTVFVSVCFVDDMKYLIDVLNQLQLYNLGLWHFPSGNSPRHFSYGHFPFPFRTICPRHFPCWSLTEHKYFWETALYWLFKL